MTQFQYMFIILLLHVFTFRIDMDKKIHYISIHAQYIFLFKLFSQKTFKIRIQAAYKHIDNVITNGM